MRVPVIRRWVIGCVLAAAVGAAAAADIRSSDKGATVANLPPPTRLVARVGDRSVALHWNGEVPGGAAAGGYHVYRSVTPGAVGIRQTRAPAPQRSWVDLDVTNGVAYAYTVRAQGDEGEGEESAPLRVMPKPFANDAEFLELLQATAFDYFWYEANPANGLVRDRSTPGSFCSIAAVGFGLTAIGIGIDHGWITREEGRARVRATLRTFSAMPQGEAPAGTIGYKGWFYHFLDMQTGLRFNDRIELSSIDTALFLGGALDAREYFDGNDVDEQAIRAAVDALVERIDWEWMTNGGETLTMGWRPGQGFLGARWMGYNEASLLYVLGLGAPRNPLPESAWTAWTKGYRWATHYGLSFVEFPPLFGHQHTQCWLDLRAVADAFMRQRGMTYFENSRRATLAQQAYAVANPPRFSGYGPHLWGFTACDGPKGYAARGAPPPENDDGTIAPTAAGGSYAFTPVESLAALRFLYDRYRPRLWTAYGFRDAFNLEADWWGPDVLGIDQGPILLMIENHRTGRVWERLRRNPVVQRGLRRAGFQPVPAAASGPAPAEAAASGALRLECLTPEVGKYARADFRLRLPTEYTHPFDPDQVQVDLQLTTPSGRHVAVPAFFAQDYERRRLGTGNQTRDWMYPTGQPGWRARFAPAETGRYRAVATVKDARGIAQSDPVGFEVTTSSRLGFVRVSPKDARFLEFSQGQPFFPIGQNLAFIGRGQHVTLSKAEEVFSHLAANGANYLRLWTCCEDWALAIEARKSAWGRSWDWRPPFVPRPGADSPERKCVELSSNRPSIDASPSHPVALRPLTRYVFKGQGRTEGEAGLRIEARRDVAIELAATGGAPVWREFRREFTTEDREQWLEPMRFQLTGTGRAWVADLSLREAAGGPELLWEAEVDRPARGWYNPVDCFMLDELVAAAETNGLYLQLCLLTRDLYMDALKEPSSPDYDRAIADAKKLLRYAVARWGYSTSVAAWEYWNEMNPNLPTDRFYAALGEYLDTVDVYQHLRTTSTWGPSPKDCRHPKLELADTHFYLRPSDQPRLRDEVEAVLDRTRWLREQAPHKPAHLGEFGLADEKWRITDLMRQSPELADFHNTLWASALSGASGTALAWWWERLDQKDAYPTYRPLSQFLKDIPWTAGGLEATATLAAGDRVRVLALRARDQAWVWLFHREAAWANLARERRQPQEITGVSFALEHWAEGPCRVQWWDTRRGVVIREDDLSAVTGTLRLETPSFTRDLAGRVRAGASDGGEGPAALGPKRGPTNLRNPAHETHQTHECRRRSSFRVIRMFRGPNRFKLGLLAIPDCRAVLSLPGSVRAAPNVLPCAWVWDQGRAAALGRGGGLMERCCSSGPGPRPGTAGTVRRAP